jgi:hypothetical protein
MLRCSIKSGCRAAKFIIEKAVEGGVYGVAPDKIRRLSPITAG